MVPLPTVPAAAEATMVHVPGPTTERFQVWPTWSAVHTEVVEDAKVTVWPDVLVAERVAVAAAVVRASSAAKVTVCVTRPTTVTAADGEEPFVALLSPSSPHGPEPQHLTMPALVAQTEDVLTATLVTEVIPETQLEEKALPKFVPPVAMPFPATEPQHARASLVLMMHTARVPASIAFAVRSVPPSCAVTGLWTVVTVGFPGTGGKL